MSELVKLSPRAQEIILDALAQIESDPLAWDQETWVSCCGTTACLAGWIVAQQDFRGNLPVLAEYADTHTGDAVPERALDILGLKNRDRRDFDNKVFYMTQLRDENESSRPLFGTIENLTYLKDRIVEVTGMEL